MRNFHLPLPDDIHASLHAEAARANRPATAIARDAIDTWLRHRRKAARHEAIAAFAAAHAGTEFDLDPTLEAAAVQHLTRSKRKKR